MAAEKTTLLTSTSSASVMRTGLLSAKVGGMSLTSPNTTVTGTVTEKGPSSAV